jgi:HTH-type transcriptional regulator/antitoxin HipB
MTQLARTPKQLGAILGRKRRLANLTQTELGRRAGLRQATISEIEGGTAATKIGTMCDLLAALDLELTVGPRSKSSSADIEEIF